MALTYITQALERVAGQAPSQFGFGVNNGRAQLLVKVPQAYLEPALRECLGYTVPNGTGLERGLPIAHPQFPWLFCERVSNAQGIQFRSKDAASSTINGVSVQLEADTLPNYARYENYELALEFVPRPYAVCKDSTIQEQEISWYDIDDTVAQKFKVKTEWWRYLEIDTQPGGEYITATQGSFNFKMDANPSGFTLKDAGIKEGLLKRYLSARTILFRWYEVPYSFVTSKNSYFDLYGGRINQTEFYGYPAGSLLMKTPARVLRTYTKPFPEFVPWNGAFLPTQQKLCDLEFEMIFVNRTLAQAYTPGAGETANGIVGGHNLVACHIDNKFYYGLNSQTKRPIYPSVPFEIFFRNPDAT